jgi:hypothetical protein
MARRQRRQLTEDEIRRLRQYGALRLPNEHIATLLNISETWLDHLLKRDNAARRALTEGRASASQSVRGTLYQLANGRPAKIGKERLPDGTVRDVVLEPAIPPDVPSLKFWCETQEGFKRADRLELTGADGGPIQTSAADAVKKIFKDPESAALARQLADRLNQKDE